MNLSKLNVQEMDKTEMKSASGGFHPTVVGFLAGWAAGHALDYFIFEIVPNHNSHGQALYGHPGNARP